ncbi:hypothetical protein sos41_18040 [Alphaproteobacteria bacterium SO-S41]|nr:hypothetical protein sos41_18040 [Alphaproteobacteria bacterium SO-S41]
MPPAPPSRLEHTVLEDAHAIFMGCLFIFVGLVMLQSAGLTTGGVAGLALLAHLLTGVAPALAFFVINLPFYAVSYLTMGREFTAKSVLVNLVLLGAGYLGPLIIHHLEIDPVFAAIGGGTMLGMGVLALARHQASVGGFTAVALFAQKRWNVPAGYVQAVSDIVILGAAAFFMPLPAFALSVVSATAISAVLFFNHKAGRYTGY